MSYLAGITSLDNEVADVPLPVSGTLPDWLRGTLLRNGPALFEAGERSFRHWFDGQSMLHRFSISDSGVSYSNRFLDTPGLRAARDEQVLRYSGFATDPCRSIFARLFSVFTPRRDSENANVNITRFGERFVALTETPLAVEFDPETLTTAGVLGYQDDLDGQVTTAHPHQAPATGDLVNYILKFGRKSEYRVYRQKPGSLTRELITRHHSDRPSYMHSFAITENHVVLAEFPFRVNPLALLLSGRPFIENYHWDPVRGTELVVIDQRDGSVRAVHRTDGLFAFHHINAFEQDGELVLDLCAYRDASVIRALYLDRLRAGGEVPQALPTRLRIGLDGGEVTREVLSEEPLELPRIDYARHNGRDYRYAYGVGSHDRRGGDFFDQLVKLDVTARETTTWYEPGCYPGEPVFVAAPQQSAEDDGVVLSVVLDSARGASFLLVLDAATFTELARAAVPHAVPFGFHGVFTRG